MKILMLGSPGAGKGTQAQWIAKKYGIVHISTGDILRVNIKNETELGKKAKIYMDQGLLVPDDLICDLVINRIFHLDVVNGYVLDGFPRTLSQAEVLTAALDQSDVKVDHVIYIEVPDAKIVNRMSGRRVCLVCGATYHVKYNPPKVEDKCDICGGVLILRDDDKPETVRKRLDIYHAQMHTLIDYYNAASILVKVDGTKDIDKVFQDIVKILGV